jgi:hypothetical protein
MQFKSAFLALVLAIGAAPLSAQVTRTDPRDRRPTTTGGTIGDIIFGDGTGTTTGRRETCRVRDAVTPDGRVVQICDDRAHEKRRDGKGRRDHVNDRDGDGDFDARDREIRKREHELAKAEKKRIKSLKKQQRGDD